MKIDPVTLASASPRRTELLDRAGIPHIVRPADVDEATIVSPEGHEATAELRARAKAASAKVADGSRIVLAADTVVIVDDESLEKALTPEEAWSMVERLAGRDHRVVTAVALIAPELDLTETRLTSTTVTFAPMSTSEIDWYVSTDEWKGVAGAYRIQEAAARFIPSITGSYSNVVGLPIATVWTMVWRFQSLLEQYSGTTRR